MKLSLSNNYCVSVNVCFVYTYIGKGVFYIYRFIEVCVNACVFVCEYNIWSIFSKCMQQKIFSFFLGLQLCVAGVSWSNFGCLWVGCKWTLALSISYIFWKPVGFMLLHPLNVFKMSVHNSVYTKNIMCTKYTCPPVHAHTIWTNTSAPILSTYWFVYLFFLFA